MGVQVDGAYQSLIQGVSQQVPIDRVDGQCTLLENFSCDPEKGLIRRAPSELVGKLLDNATGYTFYDCIVNDRDVVLAVNANGNAKACFVDSNSTTMQTVSGNYSSYLSNGNIRTLSVSEGTYIVNTQVITSMSTELTPTQTTHGIVYLLGGQYGRTYSVTVSQGDAKFIASFTTPDGSSSDHTPQVATTYIANRLHDVLAGSGSPVYSTLAGDVLYLQSKNHQKFDIAVEDGDGGANIFCFTDTIGDVGQLSKYATHGYVVKAEGNSATYVDNWYLEFSQEEGSRGFGKEGYWLECVKPATPYKYNLNTMPHILTYTEGTGFRITQVDWVSRRVGDTETNPDPSFIGNTINDMCVFQGRLVFASGDSVCMSTSDDYQDFFVNSATELVDTDPIDISSASARSTQKMQYIIPHNRDLVIFTKAAQFIVFGRNALTPMNTSLVLTTSYDTETSCSPVASGKNVFYPINYGRFTGIKEFYTEGTIDVNASRPVTSHCTQYLKGTIQEMTASTTFDLLLCRTNESSNVLYAYEYIWINEQKAQSAWSKWILPWSVQHAFYIDQLIYLVYLDDTGDAQLAKIDLARVNDSAGYQVHLDSKVYIHDVGTEIPLPYNHPDIFVVQDAGCPNAGLPAPFDIIGDTIVLKRDMGGGTVIVGIKYTSRFIPTKPVLKDSNDKSIGTGKLIVRNFKLTYTDTGGFNVKSISQYYDPIDIRYSGRILNSPSNLVGSPAVHSGVATIPFMQDVDLAELEFITDEPTPFRLNRIEYVGDYIKKGKRV